MSNGTPTSYTELAHVLDNLGLIVRERRRGLGLSLRGAAEQIGVSPSSIMRIESGEDANTRSVAAILRWLDGGAR